MTTPPIVECKDSKDAPEGTTIYEYDVELSFRRRERFKGRVRIHTASPPDRLKARWEEVWDQVENREMLDSDLLSADDDEHQEVILYETTTVKRCKLTKEMEF